MNRCQKNAYDCLFRSITTCFSLYRGQTPKPGELQYAELGELTGRGQKATMPRVSGTDTVYADIKSQSMCAATEQLRNTWSQMCVEKSAHTRVVFSNALKKRALNKLISMYEAVFCFTLCLILYYRKHCVLACIQHFSTDSSAISRVIFLSHFKNKIKGCELHW